MSVFVVNSDAAAVRVAARRTDGGALAGCAVESLIAGPEGPFGPSRLVTGSTGPDSRVALRWSDKSVVTFGASTELEILPPHAADARGGVGTAEARTVNQNVTAMVSIAVAESRAAFAAAAPTAVAVAPVVTAVTPATGARGASLTLTLSGSGFGGATAVALLRNNATDPTITVGNLAVSADGTQATVDIAIDASAPLGARVVRITTPGGSSTAVGTGGNLFTVQ